jgi:hypothetical protein
MKTLAMRARGASCFDFGFYARRNPDVAERARGSHEFLWEQFVKHGVHEGRVFRWGQQLVCEGHGGYSWQ